MKYSLYIKILVFAVVYLLIDSILLAQDKSIFLTHAQIASVMDKSGLKVVIKTDEQVIQEKIVEQNMNRKEVGDSLSKPVNTNSNNNKMVLLQSDRQILGEFLLEKSQILAGNNNIWMVSGSIVIYKVKLIKQDPTLTNENSYQFEPRSGIDYIIKKFSDGTIGSKDQTVSNSHVEKIVEFDQAILSTVSKSGSGNSIEMAINNIIRSIKEEEISNSIGR